MTKKYWYVKAFSKLTNVTVRTLHHYDHIGLLTPSIRLENGYRQYSEQDLLKLQQIIALKFFGFELEQIKKLLCKQLSLIEHLTAQAALLQEKTDVLNSAAKALKSVVLQCEDNRSINWKTTLELIEVYRMTTKLEHPWVKEVLDAQELKEYVKFEQHLNQQGSEKHADFSKRWQTICAEVKAHLDDDPNSGIGIALGEKIHRAVYELYGDEFAGVKFTLWEKGFKSGHGGNDHGLSTPMIEWIDTAMGTYWQHRNRMILQQIGAKADALIVDEFKASLTEMFGNQKQLKQELLEKVLSLDEVPEKSKHWIQNHFNSLL